MFLHRNDRRMNYEKSLKSEIIYIKGDIKLKPFISTSTA
jgi:hypothetical protein